MLTHAKHRAGFLAVFTIAVAGGRAGADEPPMDPVTKLATTVLVVDPAGADVYDKPNGVKLHTIPQMSLRVLMNREDPNESPEAKEWYCISSDGDETEGWVRAAAVRPWTSRCVLTPIGLPGREFVVKVTGGTRKDGDIVYDGHAAPGAYRLIVPILKPRANDNDPYDVVVFGANMKAIGEDSFASAKLEIVFVVDTTASNEPLLDVVRRIAGEVETTLAGVNDASMRERVRFGLVEYQDTSPGMVPARIAVKLADLPTLIKSMTSVHVAKATGKAGLANDVVAGLAIAADRADDRSFKGNVGWSSNSSKHIILCGSTSALARDDSRSSTRLAIEDVLKKGWPENIPEAAARARAEIFFHAILALHENGKDDWERARRDFNEVANNLTKTHGAYMEMEVGKKQSEDAVANQIAAIINLAAKALRGEVLTSAKLRVGEGAIGRGTYRLRDGVPYVGVVEGQARDVNDDDQVVAMVAYLLTFREVQRLKSQLTFLRETFATLSRSERNNCDRPLWALQIAFLSAGLGQPIAVSDSERSDFLRTCMGMLPLWCGISDMTAADIARMDDASYQDWIDRLTKTEAYLASLLDIRPGGLGSKEWIQLNGWNELITLVPVERLP